jgi:hypothetical protein
MDPSSSTTSSGKNDNVFTYVFSYVAVMFMFIYDNFAYISGIIIVVFGVIVYINMTKISFDMPVGRSKKLVIETMEHNMSKNDNDNDSGDNGDNDDNSSVVAGNNNNNNNNNIGSSKHNENTLLTPPIDLEKKLKSGFCNMHASKGSSATDIDNECKVFGKASCLNAECCGWVVTADNPDGMCRSGNKNGITFNYDVSGKKIDVDCYYYKETKSGPRCSS